MLPAPVTFHAKRGSFSGLRPRRPLRDVLLTRARITNLGFLLLAVCAGLSFLVNLSYYLSSPSRSPLASYYDGKFESHATPRSILDTVERDAALRMLDHLVVVPGHAIWKGTDPLRVLNEDDWLLETYQKGGGRVEAFYNHVARGVDIALEDAKALLVFSGGQTKSSSSTTEAESYLRLAHTSGMLEGHTMDGRFVRATTEPYALDSYQNLLFSVARFREYTGHYPSKITVVGYDFKRRRFEELHRAAMRWPNTKFEYVGIDAEGENLEVARAGEKRNGFLPYTKDVYGCHDMLLSKRRARNIGYRFHPYLLSSPEMVGLFEWCPGPNEGGQTALYNGPLPWD